jgi:hypothetical protein
MKFSNLNELSILELIGYTPACLRSTFLCIRHGFGLNKGSILHQVFWLTRIVGASLELAVIHSPTSVPLLTSANLLSSIGLSPLLLTVIGEGDRHSGNLSCHTSISQPPPSSQRKHPPDLSRTYPEPYHSQ